MRLKRSLAALALATLLIPALLTPAVRGGDAASATEPEQVPPALAADAKQSDPPEQSDQSETSETSERQGSPGTEVDIDVITINDFHGRIEAEWASAGAAVIAGAVQQFREDNPNTIFAGAGDLIGASTFTSFIQDDVPTIDALNAAGLEVSAAGNHEFDKGWADLRDRVQPRANWEYISANVFLSDSGEHALAPFWVTEKAGVRVGFIGAVTEELPMIVTPSGIAELETRNIVDSVNAAAAALRDGDERNGEADVLVLLVHEGAATTGLESITPDSPLGRIAYGADPGIAAIVSAHSHLAYNHVIQGRPVVAAGKYGEDLGRMRFRVDAVTKELLSVTNEVVALTANGAPLFPAKPEVQRIVDAATRDAEVLGDRQVGTVTADFRRARQSDGTENRGGESTASNFVAEVMRWSTGADIALMNPGGVRDDLRFNFERGGAVSYRDVARVLPFANTLVTRALTGAQLADVLEQQWQPASSSLSVRTLGLSAGLSYTYDPNAQQGFRITEVRLRGEVLRPDTVLTVAANPLLAGGGDNFSAMMAGTPPRDTGKIDTEAMVDWFAQHGTAVPSLKKQAMGISVTDPPSSGFVAGESVTVAVSSLVFTAGESLPSRVVLSLDGVALASAAIDPTIVDGTGESGRASLSFTVPTGVHGARELLVAVPDSGSAASVRVLFAAPSDDNGDNSGDADGGGNGLPADPGGPGATLAVSGAASGPPLSIAALAIAFGVALFGYRRSRRSAR